MSLHRLLPGLVTIVYAENPLCQEASCSLRLERPPLFPEHYSFDLSDLIVPDKWAELQELRTQKAICSVWFDADSGDNYSGSALITNLSAEPCKVHFVGIGTLLEFTPTGKQSSYAIVLPQPE